ncbi:MAG: ABC transporter permease [Deltaproteobacteria bacterium]|nr:ABC transporter permease [Deltaproteobacteria bacterium]MCW5801857.1 ABC transporter permease [Deltaproteobacteria bacterium]
MIVLLVLGLPLALGLLLLLLYIAIAFARMGFIGVMQWRDLFSLDRWQEVFSTIGRNKLRTALTAISIAWGIFVLVFLLGLGRGLSNGVEKSFARDATNGVWMSAGKTSEPYGGFDIGRRIMFDNRDYDRAKKVDGVEHMAAQHWIRGQRWGGFMTRRNGKANAFAINAVHADANFLAKHDIVQGRFLSAGDILEKRKSAVIGNMVREFLFAPGEDPVGEWILVAGVPFEVVGVFSDPQGSEQERQVYVPVTTAQLAFSGGDKIGTIQLTVGDASASQTEAIIDQIRGQLSERHGFSPTDKMAVRVQNNVEVSARFRSLFWMISTFVVVIGLGTLAAGVVGVSNIMMIAVKERTKEIGVRKALGATPRSIIFMIIQEAVFLTGVAGTLGLAGGVLALQLVERWVESDFIVNPRIDIGTGVSATIFLVLAGALAGYFPARAAAKVNPIHALRDQ